VAGGAVWTVEGVAEVAPLSLVPPRVVGVVAAGAFTVGELLVPDDDARSAKNNENAATKATPRPASQRVVDEMRRMPSSRSAGRRGAMGTSLAARHRPRGRAGALNVRATG
jgi:hypothetical protein